ncbi:sensitivity to high expression protein she9 [Tulasnella sp. 418]|nr:sensitivity to high expression protein she9 [Tulasnella sp. 418]
MTNSPQLERLPYILQLTTKANLPPGIPGQSTTPLSTGTEKIRIRIEKAHQVVQDEPAPEAEIPKDELGNAQPKQSSSSVEQTPVHPGYTPEKSSSRDEAERWRRNVEKAESKVNATLGALREAKITYEDAISTRYETQRKMDQLINRQRTIDLLKRKYRKLYLEASEVEGFLAALNQAPDNERNEQNAKAALGRAEEDYERSINHLLRAISDQYREEQARSDKIRGDGMRWSKLAIGGTLAGLTLNITLMEPLTKSGLMETVEERIRAIVQAGVQEEEVSTEAKMTELLQRLEVFLSHSTTSPLSPHRLEGSDILNHNGTDVVVTSEPDRSRWLSSQTAKVVGFALVGGIIIEIISLTR